MQLAYLDPGSGSLIASAVVGGAAAAGVALKSARSRITGALSRKRRPDGADGEGAGDGGRAEVPEVPAASSAADGEGAGDGAEPGSVAGD